MLGPLCRHQDSLAEMSQSRKTLVWGGWCLAVGILNLSVLGAVFQLSRHDASASHLLLVPVVSAVLLYRNRTEIFHNLASDRTGALLLSIMGLALISIARFTGTISGEGALSVAMSGVILLWIAGFLGCYGRQAFGRALFPLAFLIFAIPIPSMILDPIESALKSGSAEVVAGLFTLVGTPYHRQEFTFTLPSFAIEIADECSGIRSSIALLLTLLLAGHMLLSTYWKKAVLVAAVLPLVILKNGIRIVTLSLLATHVDAGFLTGQLHHEGGIVFFLLTLALILPMLAVLRRSEG